MDIQRDEAFEEAYSKICKPIIARPYPRNEKGEYIYKEIHEAHLMWQAKAQAVPYESCSRKSHEIIINETKNKLINSYDIAKEDEYLLESLVFRGVCIGVAVTTPHLPKWISINDKEPPLGVMVLICWSDAPDVEPEKDYMDQDVDHGVNYWANYNDGDEPSHWMLLPEPVAQEQSHD